MKTKLKMTLNIAAALIIAAVIFSTSLTAYANSSSSSVLSSSRTNNSSSSASYRYRAYLDSDSSSYNDSSSMSETTSKNDNSTNSTSSIDENYAWVMEYLNENAVLDDSQNAVLANQDIIDFTTKGMYTISTKNGNVFYLIIDSKTHEVFFLNKVDDNDLYALTESNAMTNNNTATVIINSSSEIQPQVQAKSQVKSNSLFMIIIFGGAILIAIFIILKRKGINLPFSRKTRDRRFVDDSFDEDDDDEY